MRVLFLICTLLICSVLADGNLLLTDAQLVLKASATTISAETFEEHPDLYDYIGAHAQGSFFAAFIKTAKKELVFSGYEGFYAPYPNTYPSAIFYEVVNGTLVETSRLAYPVGTGQTNALIAPLGNRNYIVTSPNIPVGSVTAMTTHRYPLRLHNYTDTGIISQTANYEMDLSVLHPNFYNATLAYNGLCGISSDGKYALITYATGANIPGAITGQKHHILKVNSNNGGFTSAASTDTYPTGIPRLYSFPQKCLMVPFLFNSNKYHYICGENSFNLTVPTGLIAHLVSYVFDVNAGTLTRVDAVPVSQYIQGIDVDSKNMIVYINVVETASTGLSIRQFPRASYPNNAANSNYQLIALRINPLTGKLTAKGGINYNGDGIGVQASPCGNYLAVTNTPITGNDVFTHNFPGLGNVARIYSPSTLNLYRVYQTILGDIRLKLLDVTSGSPLTFGLAFDNKSERLVVFGQATYRRISGTMVAGQKDVQLYDIKKTGIFDGLFY